jgi:hypothetical protein
MNPRGSVVVVVVGGLVMVGSPILRRISQVITNIAMTTVNVNASRSMFRPPSSSRGTVPPWL